MHLQSSIKNRFMVRDAVSKASQSVDPAVNIAAAFPGSGPEAFVQCSAPEIAVVASADQANPKRELQFCDDVIM